MMSSAVRRAPSDWYLGIDRGLPQLAAAFDLPAVSRLYEERWPGRAEAGLRVSARKVHDVEYQPSARCVVTHELTLKRGGGEPVETIGVIDVRPAGLGLRAFHEDPDLPWLADAADPVKVGRHLWARELAPGCRVRVIPLRYKPGSPCLLPFDQAIRRLESAAHEEPAAVPSHGSFRSDQLLIEGDEPLMIDLDELCWANPARDVGNFLAYLRWKSIRQPRHSSFIEAAIPSFLAGYGSVLMLPDERWTARYQAGSMLKIAGRRFRKLDVSEWPLVPRLLDEARALLGLTSPAAASHAAVPTIPASVRAALDVEGMTVSLRPFLGSFADGTAGPVVTKADLVWHKPDHRWTIRYALDGDGAALLGKMYRDTARGRRVHDIMRWLWDQAASGTPELGVPRPLGWIPELSMLAYVPVAVRVLGDAIFDARAAAYMDMAAALLSALDGSVRPLDDVVAVRAGLANVR